MFQRFNRLPNVRYGAIGYRPEASVSASALADVNIEMAIEAQSTIEITSEAAYGIGTAFENVSEFESRANAPIWIETEFRGSSGIEAENIRVIYIGKTEPYGLFNRTRFNRFPIKKGALNGGSSFGGSITVYSEIELEFNANAFFNAENYKSVIADIIMSAMGTLTTESGAIKRAASTFSAESGIIFDPYVVEAEIMEFTGSGFAFKPGDIIEIDLCNYYATQNGVNIMDKFNGTFFRFYPGDNTLIWQDDKTARRIESKIRYQNKYL